MLTALVELSLRYKVLVLVVFVLVVVFGVRAIDNKGHRSIVVVPAPSRLRAELEKSANTPKDDTSK